MLLWSGKWSVFIEFSSFSTTQSAFTTQVNIPAHFTTKSQPAHRELIHTHIHTHSAAIRSNLGLSILPKGT